ncbi:MAG TPA: hypothetical protein VFW73_12690 [Lacipirellulaceae bacterium]|nr:hypothetical protein [Lacipirellulaceae bacterium]
MSHGRFVIYVALYLGYCISALPNMGWAAPAIQRNFDGPKTSWQLLTTSTPARILAQQCLPGGARENRGFERVVVAAPAGESALLVCPIPRAAVLDELKIRLWVNASQPSVEVAARVVLPRSLDAQRRGPATAIIRGSVYSRPGQWQELNIADVPRLVADQVRVMRAMPGASIDSHEAYIDAVVLIVPGNPSGLALGTDNLQVDGVLLSAETGAVHPYGMTTAAARDRSSRNATYVGSMSGANGVNAVGDATSAANTANVRLDGSTLYVDGKPFLPRVIQWNGETMQFLSGCGFNVVQLPTVPTAEQSAEAERYGLWFVCTPPHPDAIASAGLGKAGDRVLAWQLQDDALEVDPNYAMRWAELVRERDDVFGRPVLTIPQSNWPRLAEASDILVARHPRIGLLSPTQIQSWFANCPQRAKPGTPLWIFLSTQGDEAARGQISAITHQGTGFPCIDDNQLESDVQVACANGARGFLFQSASLLSDVDEQTRQRAACLHLINRRLQLLEPWLAVGKVVERVVSSDGAYTGVVLYVDRSRLLIPVPNETRPLLKALSNRSRSTENEIVFTVPGIPETSEAFYLSPAAMHILSSERVAGGTRVKLPSGGEGFILMTEDPKVVQSLRERIAREGSATVQLERDLAAQQARALASAGQRLTQLSYSAATAMQEAALANQQTAQVDSLLAGGHIEEAHILAANTRPGLDRVTEEQHRAVAPSAAFESDPLAMFFDTLPQLAAFERSFATLRPGDNLLQGGDFEDLPQMTQSGWQNVTRSIANVQASARLSAEETQHGRYCLELSATRTSANEQHSTGSELIWIVSPPVAVDEKQTVEISGWVRVDQPFSDGEGLQIVDSLGGPSLSLVVGQTNGWQPFRLIRAATEPAKLRITFALTGLGSAKIDAVMVRMFNEPIAQRLPPARTTGPVTATRLPEPTGARFAAPATR